MGGQRGPPRSATYYRRPVELALRLRCERRERSERGAAGSCRTDLRADCVRRESGKADEVVPLPFSVRSAKGTRRRLWVDFNGRALSVPRLGAFVFGNPGELSWEEFNETETVRKVGGEGTYEKYKWHADHLREPNNTRDQSAALSRYLRVERAEVNLAKA